MVGAVIEKLKSHLFGIKSYKNRKKSVGTTSVYSTKSIYSDQSNDLPIQSNSKKSLFRYATWSDVVLYIFAMILSVVSGCGISSYAIIVAQVVNYFVLVKDHKDENFHLSLMFMAFMIADGLILFTLSFVQYYIYHALAIKIVSRIRCDYLKSLLHQDLTFFEGDHKELTNNIEKIRSTLSDKIGAVIRTLVQLASCLTAAFLFCWQLSLALVALVPFVILWSEIMAKITQIFTSKEATLSSQAKNHAEEILGGVRIVQAFNAQKFEIDRYEKKLSIASKYAHRKNILNGITSSVLHLSIYLYLFAGTLYGAWLYQNYAVPRPGNLFVVLACITGCAFPMSGIRQQIMAVWDSRNAAETIYKIIDQVPKIDFSQKAGHSIKNASGESSFENVWFKKDSTKPNEDHLILRNLSFEILPGETVAFLGDEKDGVYLIPDLISRFYDVDQGQVKINGNDIRRLNIKFLRSIVAYIDKDPELFNATVDDNIRMGNTKLGEDDIVAFSKLAEAHEFIQEFRNGYKTLIEDDEEFPTVEQRQRIALARELARQPKILILNEAYSIVDHVKRLTETMLGNASLILITSRPDDARKADKIFVLQKGAITESGTHEELLNKSGHYAELYEKNHYKFHHSNSEELENVHETDENTTFLRKSLLMALRKEFTHVERYEQSFRIKGVKISKTHNFMDLIKLTRNYKLLYFFGFVFSFLNAFAIPMYTKINGEYFELYETPREEGTDFFWRATQISKYYIIIGTVCSVSLAIYIPIFGKIGEDITNSLKIRLFGKILNKNGAFFDSPTGDQENLLNMLHKDAANCRAALDLRLGQFINTLCMFAMGYSTSLQKNIVVGTIVSICFFIQPVLQYLAARKEFKERKEIGKLDGTGEVAMEALERIKTVQALNCQNHFCKQFERASQKILKAKMKLFVFEALKFATANGLQQITTGFAYMIGYCAMWGDFLKAPLMIHRITQTMLPSASNGPFIPAFMEEIEASRIAAANVMPLIKEKAIVPEEKEAMIDIQGDVEFKNVHFSYPSQPNRPILHDISFQVENGRTMVIVGPPDSGKGTLFNLLERFYEPKEGKISIDTQDLAKLDIQNVRTQMSLATPHLFSGTIAENIGYGVNIDLDVPMMDVIEAAKEANLDRVVCDMPEGYDTQVGTHGKQIPKGIRQRIALARALLRNPKILLFNMPPRDIDDVSEKAIFDALERIRLGRTCIILSRQAPPPESFDDIIYIDKGRIIGECFDEVPELPHLHHKHHRTPRKISGVTRLYLWDPPSIQMGLL